MFDFVNPKAWKKLYNTWNFKVVNPDLVLFKNLHFELKYGKEKTRLSQVKTIGGTHISSCTA